MHIPSERVYNKMRSETASLWYVPANDGEETAFIIKAPTPTIKALISGCPMQLFFGKRDCYLCIGVQIEDVPGTPLFISGVQIEAEEHNALIQSIKQRVFPIFLFNEMDICFASSSVRIIEEEAFGLLNFIKDETGLYVGPFNEKASETLDCFAVSVDKRSIYPDAQDIPVVRISPEINEWEAHEIYFIGNDSFHKVNISDKMEGKNFENTIWGALESVFPTTLCKSPQVRNGQKVRELTDVFAYYEYGSFLIEAKDLSVIQAGYNKYESKRLAGIQKQVEKAIKQLIGATNVFMRGNAILDGKKHEIIVNRKQPPHCIILIAELMHCGDWTDITNHLIYAMVQTGAFFHLLDLREFITLLKQSSGDPKLIDYNLMQRCKLFYEKKSVHIRGV